jgi:exopolyphosphatase/guanosine-5'-triphosphate,3'-diphosphate pyrophosphatase
MRVATIDIGTNTVLLLVAERGADGVLRAVEERATITRLGEGVDRTRCLLPAAVERTCACLGDYGQIVRHARAERVAIIGTSAMRDARGADELRAFVRATFGVEARVVSGDEEAQLSFSGALSGLPAQSTEDVSVFDIGGGSTEVIVGRTSRPPVISFAASYDLGSVRLTERHVSHDPLTPEERETIVRTARDAFLAVPLLPGAREPIGIAGTMTTLAAVSLALVPYDGARVHNTVMTRLELEGVVAHLARLDLPSRRALPGMEPKRADVIVAGGLIALALLDHWGARAVRISDRGVRWGLADELAR